MSESIHAPLLTQLADHLVNRRVVRRVRRSLTSRRRGRGRPRSRRSTRSGSWCAGAPSARGEVVEREQHIEIVSDFRGRFGPFRAAVGGEHFRGFAWLLSVFGVVDLSQCLLRIRMGRFRQCGKDIADLVPPAPLLFGVGGTRRGGLSKTPGRRHRPPAPGHASRGVCNRAAGRRKMGGRDSAQVDSVRETVTSREEVRPMNATTMWVLPLVFTVGR
jgi:hypothetical protein